MPGPYPVAFHAFSFGWLVGGLLERDDGGGGGGARGLEQCVTEIATQLGVVGELRVGLSPAGVSSDDPPLLSSFPHKAKFKHACGVAFFIPGFF